MSDKELRETLAKLGWSETQIEHRIEERRKLDEWKNKILARGLKIEKIAAFGPIVQIIPFSLILIFSAISIIPAGKNFLNEHSTLSLIYLLGVIILTTIGFILSNINNTNNTYKRLKSNEEFFEKMHKQLEEENDD